MSVGESGNRNTAMPGSDDTSPSASQALGEEGAGGEKVKQKMSCVQKTGCGCLAVIALFIGIGAIGSMAGGGKGDRPTGTAFPEVARKATLVAAERNGNRGAPKPESLASGVEKYLAEAFGEKAGDKMRFIEIEEGPYPVDGKNGETVMKKRVLVRFWLDTVYSNKLSRDELLINSIPMFQKVYTDPACDEIAMLVLEPQLTLVDKYGNASREGVAQFTLYRHTAEKVKWENIQPRMMEQLLKTEGKYWFHPVLLRED